MGILTGTSVCSRNLALAAILVVMAGAVARPSVSVAILTASADLGGNTFTTPRTWYFVHNQPTPPTGDTAAVNNLSMNGTVSTQATLYNYDTNYDALPGRRIQKSGTGPGDTTLAHYVNWRTANLSAPTLVSGNVVVRVWSGISGFPLAKQGVLVAYLRDFNPTTSTYVEIANATLTDPDWQAGSSTWVLKRIVVPLAGYTIASGHRLEVKIETTAAAYANMVVAYDTTSQPSSVGLP